MKGLWDFDNISAVLNENASLSRIGALIGFQILNKQVVKNFEFHTCFEHSENQNNNKIKKGKMSRMKKE